MKNPLNGEDLSRDQVERLNQLGKVRHNARKAARSGNPAKREPARRVLSQIPTQIRVTYYRRVWSK